MEADVNFRSPETAGPRQQYQQPTTPTTTTTATFSTPVILTSSAPAAPTTPEFDFQSYCADEEHEKGNHSLGNQSDY